MKEKRYFIRIFLQKVKYNVQLDHWKKVLHPASLQQVKENSQLDHWIRYYPFVVATSEI